MGNVPFSRSFFRELPLFFVKGREEGVSLIIFHDFRNIEGVCMGQHFPVHMLAADDKVFPLRQSGQQVFHRVERSTPSGALYCLFPVST